MIKLSIVVAVYNLEKYLPKCLDSLVNQTLNDIEILCVDDGSTDSAPRIIDEYEKKYPEKVKAFHKPNGGEFTTRNYGLERATGEYVTFVDTDDYVEQNWAEKLYNTAKENEADIAVCGFDTIDEETGKVVSTNMTGFEESVKNITSQDDFILYINTALWNKIYKTEKIKDLRFSDIRGFNDMIFNVCAYTRVKKIAFIKDVLYHYYLRSSSQIHTLNNADIEKLEENLLKLKEFYIKTNNYNNMKELLDMFVFIHLGTSAMYRVSYDKSINMRKLLKQTTKYLNDNFPTWKKSPFLKIKHCFPKGIKHIGLWGIQKLYKWHIPIVYIRLYRFMIDILKIDIKF